MRKSSQKHPSVMVEVIGWLGVLAILAAYFGVSFSYLAPDHWVYYTLNAAGSAGILVDAYVKKDYQPVLLNVVWLAIAALGLLGIGR